MESNEASRQLADVERFKSRTVSESLRGRPAGVPLLVVATFLFFSSFEIESQWVGLVAGVVWMAFIVLWVRWLRSDNRARSTWRAMSPRVRTHVVVGWIVGLIAANLAAFIGEKVSWILGGALMAAVVAFGGVVVQGVWGK